MRNFLFVASVVIGCIGFTSIADAGTKRYPRAQVGFEVPDAWSEEIDGSRFIVSDAKKEAVVIFSSLDVRELKVAASELGKSITAQCAEAKWEGKNRPVTINGLKAMTREGTCKYKNTLVNMGVVLVASPTGRVLLVTTLVNAERRIDHKETLVNIVKSLKPSTPKSARRPLGDTKLSIEIPDDWREEKKANAVLLAHPSGDATVIFIPLDIADLKAATSSIDGKLSSLFTDLKWEKSGTEKKLNGMKAWVVEGSGKHDGTLANLWVVAAVAPNGKVVMTIVRVNADMRTKYKPVASKILSSLKAS
jgi:hypothetical protein